MVWFVALLPVFFSSLAVGRAASVEKALSAVERARELVLSSDRTEAIRIFRELHTLGKLTREQQKAWEEIAAIFISDKGQNQYSLADSYWFARPKDAIELLVATAKLEDGNLLISILAARAALRLQECGRADAFTEQAEQTFPLSMEVKLLRLQVQDCQNGGNASLPPLRVPMDVEWGPLDSAVRLLLVRDASRRRDWKAVRAGLTAWETQAAEDPEFWFWKWRLVDASRVGTRSDTGVLRDSNRVDDSLRDRSAGRKYLRYCAELTPRRRKKLAIHPRLCSQTEVVEADIKAHERAIEKSGGA
ncbi:MAG: hypothetical protein RBT63_07770 [Bdellovibrionales bacterium]|nr:hypothetical protein [Bdellovibrionales bacterium]